MTRMKLLEAIASAAWLAWEECDCDEEDNCAMAELGRLLAELANKDIVGEAGRKVVREYGEALDRLADCNGLVE